MHSQSKIYHSSPKHSRIKFLFKYLSVCHFLGIIKFVIKLFTDSLKHLREIWKSILGPIKIYIMQPFFFRWIKSHRLILYGYDMFQKIRIYYFKLFIFYFFFFIKIDINQFLFLKTGIYIFWNIFHVFKEFNILLMTILHLFFFDFLLFFNW